MTTARPTVSVDNAVVRVSTWTLGPGDGTGPHQHDLDYVVVPLTAGQLAMTSAAGRTTSELAPGGCYFREAGVQHDVSNVGPAPVVFVEVEVKRAPSAAVQD